MPRDLNDILLERGADGLRHEWDAAHIQRKNRHQRNNGERSPVNGHGDAHLGLQIIAADSVEPEPIDWLWPGRIALGKLTLIAGEPGIGKSQIACDIAARISARLAWPDKGNAPCGQVLMMSAEDGLADTINPRLQAAYANLGCVHIIECVRENGRERSVNLQLDLVVIAAAVAGMRDGRLLIVDPITAYLGDIDSHRTTDVRAVLEPLSRMAEALKIAVVAVTHPPKAA